jgi:hypothetical protein
VFAKGTARKEQPELPGASGGGVPGGGLESSGGGEGLGGPAHSVAHRDESIAIPQKREQGAQHERRMYNVCVYMHL